MSSDTLNKQSGLTLPAPAKINLMLSVHGLREDGFHALTSLVCAVEFGDSLTVSMEESVDELECSEADVPLNGDNLILKAAELFRKASGLGVYFKFVLEKRIPMGAGLGGGSSDAATALKAMNVLTGGSMELDHLEALAAELGSDCPFFIRGEPAVMRGRGEVLEPLDEVVAGALRGKPVALFQPEFPVETAWAYQVLREGAPQYYEAEADAMERLNHFRESRDLASLLANSFEAAVGKKYLAIPTLLEALRSRERPCLMSGSGSCCFALGDDLHSIRSEVESAWGQSVFWVETSVR